MSDDDLIDIIEAQNEADIIFLHGDKTAQGRIGPQRWQQRCSNICRIDFRWNFS